MAKEHLQAFLQEVGADIGRDPLPDGDEVLDALAELKRASSESWVSADWADPLRLRCEPPLISKHITEALRLVATKESLQHIAPLLEDKLMPWKQPAAEYKSAMLVGDCKYGSLFESPTIYAGLMHIPPNTFYPLHAHDATEVWYILEGTAKWIRQEGETVTARMVPPRGVIHHESKQAHGVRTAAEGVLGFYIWVSSPPALLRCFQLCLPRTN
jgi:mannose-6-phosphate isomerase-like protein (cupin superfamily)